MQGLRDMRPLKDGWETVDKGCKNGIDVESFGASVPVHQHVRPHCHH